MQESESGAVAQEPWDYDRFVEAYNSRAKLSGGWFYEPDGRTPEDLEAQYRWFPEVYPTVAIFAEGVYMYQQNVE